MSANGTVENNKLVLRDLQGLLQKSINKELTVIDYETTALLPPGENYGSTMLKVDAVIKRSKNSEEEKLALVAKMIPTAEFQKSHFNAFASFAKEIFVIDKLILAFRELEMESGVSSENLIDIVPKYYGGRMTMNEEIIDKADDDVVMLMENIKVKGFYTNDRRQGLDYDHAKLAISELARFHALSMGLKYKKPEFFEEAKKIITVFPFELEINEFDDVIEHTLNMICSDARIAKFEDRIRQCVEINSGFESFMKAEIIEPWVSIFHGDFWVNNIMFSKDGNGKVRDVKFVDFQLSNVGSPLKDLPYFLCASVNPNVTDKHLHDLLDLYYNKFIEVLSKIGCDTSLFSKESFLEQLKKIAGGELFHCLMALKFFTMEVTEDVDLTDIKSNVMMTGGSDLYINRSWKIISMYIKMNWL